MTRLNCPNCGAPIDIHRRSCEYCGTPYDNGEEISLYADNKKVETVYIHKQDAVDTYENDLRRLQAGLSQLAQCNAISLAAARARLDAATAATWEEERIRQCMNSVPLTSYGPLTEPKVEVVYNRTDGIWKVVRWMLKALIALTPIAAIIILSYIF